MKNRTSKQRHNSKLLVIVLNNAEDTIIKLWPKHILHNVNILGSLESYKDVPIKSAKLIGYNQS